MILTELSKYLQEHNDEIIQNRSAINLLTQWVVSIMERVPITNVDRIIHTEIAYSKNKAGDFMLVGKSESGRKLTNALYNFALSYEQHLLKKWLENKKPDDFTIA